MFEAFVFGLMFLLCAILGLSIVLAGLTMAALDARYYEARRQADLEIAGAGQRVASDVLLTLVGTLMLIGGTSGLLATIGIL